MGDSDAARYVEKHFHPDVLWALRCIRPGAFRADLFRYCIMYREGGVYSDVKQKLLVPIGSVVKQRPVFVRDKKHGQHFGVQISFMAAAPEHPIFDAAIRQIVTNVQNKDRCCHFLAVTGPILFGALFAKMHPSYNFKFQQHGAMHLATLDGTTLIEKMRFSENGFESGRYAKMWHDGDLFDASIPIPCRAGLAPLRELPGGQLLQVVPPELHGEVG